MPTKRQPGPGKSAVGKKRDVATKTTARKKPSGKGATGSKRDNVLSLLRRLEGASLDALIKAAGWQKHSVRGFLAGTVRKKLKLPLVSEKVDNIRTYRIVSNLIHLAWLSPALVNQALESDFKATVSARKAMLSREATTLWGE